MELKRRANINVNKFYVKKDSLDSTRKLYYRFFTLDEDYDSFTTDQMTPLKYWNTDNIREAEVDTEPGKFVLLAETDNGLWVDKYWSFPVEGDTKNDLKIVVKKDRKYGDNAYKITISWGRKRDAESINSHYIYLMGPEGEKYHFLTELIAPEDPSGNKRIDEYIFELPEGDELKSYNIEVDDSVRCVYDVDIIM